MNLINNIGRKLRQIAVDPVLRNWLLGRMLGRNPAEPAFSAHCPPYLSAMLPLARETTVCDFPVRVQRRPDTSISLALAGQTLTLQSGQEAELFKRSFADTETLLALHRFAWLPELGDDVDANWLDAIWSAWRQSYGTVDDSWAWHPYTASERVINILRFGERHGLPGPIDDTLDVLASHGPAIAAKLEYFGDHHTSNHLANNGRGLFILGLSLGMAKCAEMGGHILTQEAPRIFMKSGILREGSSHYHALLARNYYFSWQAAKAHARPETEALRDVVDKSFGVLKALSLPGGMPLVGDISPDCPPSRVWGEIEDHVEASESCDLADLAKDGWLRYDHGPWSGLWHASPQGWSHMPGHGHQDCGGFELHFNNTPLFIDPGRGAYGEDGGAALYRSAAVHNSLTLNGVDPYPANKPYFDQAFRRRIAGPPPDLSLTDKGVSLSHSGFSRLGAVGMVSRAWSFHEDTMTLADRVEGSGVQTIKRTLCTEFVVTLSSNDLILENGALTFRLRIDGGTPIMTNATRWSAYGAGKPATFISVTTNAELPWHGSMTLEKA